MFWEVLKEDVWKDDVPLHSWSGRGTLGQEQIAMIFLFVDILLKYNFCTEKFTQAIFHCVKFDNVLNSLTYIFNQQVVHEETEACTD